MEALKPGDAVHFRIFGNDTARKELVDIVHKISRDNLAPGRWGAQIADKVDPAVAKIGEKENDSITFNPVNPLINSTYAAQRDYTQAMSIIQGGGTTPVNPTPPVARISGPTALKSGEAYTFTSAASTGYNGPLLRQWVIPGLESAPNGVTASGKAYTVTTQTVFKARLNVRDQENGKTDQAEFEFTVSPPGSGEQYPPYVPGGQHEAGQIYSHNGVNYKCKYTSWCSGSPQYYEPGAGLAWAEAWDKL